MDIDELKERLPHIVRLHFLPIVLGCIGLLFLGYGVISLSHFSAPKNEITLEQGNDSLAVEKASATQDSASKQIIVDVEGAVLKPGVYHLSPDARIQDALVASGGLSAQADRKKIAQVVNLAAKLHDGAKLYLPFVGDQTSFQGGGDAQSTVLGTSDSLVNINTANEQGLDSLPGVGSVTAGKIIQNRPYNSIQELLDKKVVSSKVFGQIKDKVTAE